MTPWSILYRGPLSSCNYACTYCPFAKTRNTRAELAEDARKLERFVDWVEAQAPRRLGLLFTPWGEALIRRPYQEALVRLSRMAHVASVAIQTNLSARLAWSRQADKDALALWCTFHPSQIEMEAFLEKIDQLRELGVRHSVGMVGLREDIELIERMRAKLPASTYLWVNAYKRGGQAYYSDEELERIEAVDPLFRLNTRYHPSQGRACAAGSTSFSVDGDGQARRCHFIREPIGNIYDEGFATSLAPRPCSNASCGCYIGYVHLEPLALGEVYGDGLLERIPDAPLWRDDLGRAHALAAVEQRLALELSEA